MKKIFAVIIVFALIIQLGQTISQPGLAGEQVTMDAMAFQGSHGMPGWPIPAQPIPHHEPGHLSRAGSYTTQVFRANEAGVQELVEISGVDALAADGLDPLAGNYTLVTQDQILRSQWANNQFSLETLAISDTISQIPGSLQNLGNYPYHDIAVGDLNNDDQSEQIVAWMGGPNHIYLSTGEMPGSPGRTTSAPAAVPHGVAPPDGYALEFNGSNNYVDVGDQIYLDNTSFTVAFWARRNAINRTDFVVGQGVESTNMGLHIGFRSTNQFTCAFYANDLDTTAYTDTDWHHWACTYDSGTNLRTIYRDGVLVAQASAAAYAGTGHLYISRSPSGTPIWGLVDQVGVWSTARTPDQIEQDMIRSTPDETDLVAYWPFDEGSGTTAADISGNGHDGTLVNNPVWGPENAPQGELGEIHLLARGFDEALWHCNYDVDSGLCLNWNNSAGGFLLSGPAVASLGTGQFDVFAIGTDNQVYRHHWEGSWSGDWQQVGNWPHAAPTWTGPTPELPSPSVVARDGGFDMFRIGPDYTLRWHDGSVWQTLGGMLSSAPGAVSLGADHMQVFARGVDDVLWYLTYNSGNWSSWQRLPSDGMPAGVSIASPPAAVSPAASQIKVYVRGSDDQSWSILYDGSSWGAWSATGGELASRPGVAVWSGTTYQFAQQSEALLQSSHDGVIWGDLGGLPPCCTVQDTASVAVTRIKDNYQDYTLDIETGHFWGDARSQIALAYFSANSTVQIKIFESGERFSPELVTQLELPQDIDYFRMTTGDFLDGDGIDDIALVYVRNNTYNLDVIKVTRTGLSVEVTGALETVTIPDEDGDDYEYGYFSGTLDITAGDFDGDGQDEIGLVTVWHNPDWIYLTVCDSWLFSMRMRVYDLLEDPGTGIHSLESYYVGTDTWGGKGAWWGEAIRDEPYDVAGEVIGLSITAGDTNGDGKDELVRTWPSHFGSYADSCSYNDEPVTIRFNRYLQVLELPDNPDRYTNTWDSGAGDGIIDSPLIENVVLLTPIDLDNSYQERLVVGDLNRDIQGEIAWLMSNQLRTYYYDPESTPTYQPFTGSIPLAPMVYPKLAPGPLTGESIRVGPPNYRRQYSVGQITAIINAPPKHADVLDGVEYNINADDPATKAQLTLEAGTTTHVSLTTKRDWGLSTTFAATIGNPEASHTTNSLTTTYGENFSNETGYLTTFDIQQTREASADDALFYMRTDYDVWEYPILTDSTGNEADYITIVFPASEPRLRVDRGNTCDSWYQPRHELDNVWSYPSNTEQLVDRDEAGGGDLISSSDYLVSSDPSSFTVQFTEVEETKQTSGFDLGISNEFEWQIGGEELSFEIMGVGFSSRLPSFKFSSKADYNYSELAEWEMTTTDSTEVYGYLNGVPGGDTAGYDYAVWPYLYWTEAGYLMLDYTTSTEGTFWTRYDKPDPAFTLPWADGQCNTAEDPQTEAFTRDIHIDPPVASAGEPVTLTATVRNFSLQSNTQSFDITFYQGDPDVGGTQIGTPQTIAAYTFGPRAVKTVTVHWTAAGDGEQRIYAVIDPTNQLAEVHDETDPYVNNNKGYGLLRMGALDFVDMGEAEEKIYYPITYGLNPTMQTSLFVPVGNLAENTRFDFQDADLAVSDIAGKAFELLAYRGEDDWDDPEENFSFQPDTDHPPAVMILSYGDSDIAGMNENNLTLYRLGTGGWQDAACPNYEVQRFLQDNMLVVPICQASLFVLAEVAPPFAWDVYMPIVTRN